MEENESSEATLATLDELSREMDKIEARLNQDFHDLYRAHMDLILSCSSLGAAMTPTGKNSL